MNSTLFWMRHDYEIRKEKLQMWIAWHMPRWLVKLCAVRLISHATCGEYGSTVVPELTAIDALRRWRD